MTLSDSLTIENSSKSLFIEQPEKKYTKISKDLHKLMMTGCSKCTAAAYQTYSFCISMHPDSVITPTKIAASLKNIAEKNGGKALSERTIRRHLAMLEKVDLVEREYLKDKEGKFLGGIWRFFSLNSNGHKWPLDDSNNLEDNPTISKEKIEENPEKPIGQKGPPVYNKERARISKTNYKTNSPPKVPPKINPESTCSKNKIVDGFKARIKKESLSNDFNHGTYNNLKKLNLTDGQIKTLIDRLNHSNAYSCGWLIKEAERIGAAKIDDLDRIYLEQKKKIELERMLTAQAKKQSEIVIDGYAKGAENMRNSTRLES